MDAPGGARRQERPPFVGWSQRITEDWHQVVIEPGVFDLWESVSLTPNTLDVTVINLRWRGHDAELDSSIVGHGAFILFT